MAIVSNTVNYVDGATVLEGFFAYNDAVEGRRPAVLICHAWGGRDDFVKEKAVKLAELGYLGFAVDMYGQGQTGNSHEENAKLMQPFMEDRAMLQARITMALKTVRLMPWVDDKQVAVIGFCFGGLCALDLARTGADIKAAVSFHGLFIPADNIPSPVIKAKVLLLHGYDDPMNSMDQVVAIQKELTDAGADWQLHSYGNTMHAFTNPVANDPGFGTVYDAQADQRSWNSLKLFLDEVFD